MSIKPLIAELSAWRSLLASNHYAEKVALLDSTIAILSDLQKIEVTGLSVTNGLADFIVDKARASTDTVAAALVHLAYQNVPPDVQDLLVSGDPAHSVAPGALKHALDAVLALPAPR